MRKVETAPIDNEHLSGNQQIKTVSWGELYEQNSLPFSPGEVIDITKTSWKVSPEQLTRRPGHITYLAGDDTVHFKAPDPGGIFEPLYEVVTYELGAHLGNHYAPTSVAYNTLNGDMGIGTASLVLFKEQLSVLGENIQSRFFRNCDLTALIGEFVLGVWVGSYDIKSEHIILGKLEVPKSGLFYYLIDHSHCMFGPDGNKDIEKIGSGFLVANFKHLAKARDRFGEVIEKSLKCISRLKKMDDKLVKEVCTGNAKKMAQHDSPNAREYLEMGEKIGSILVERKNEVVSSITVFLQGMAVAV